MYVFILTLLVDFFNQAGLNDESQSRNTEEYYGKTEKDESLLVNFLHPISSGHRFLTPDLMSGASHFDSYNIFRDSPDRNLFHP